MEVILLHNSALKSKILENYKRSHKLMLPTGEERSPVTVTNGKERSSTTLFLEYSREKLIEQYWPRLRGCVESLTDQQVWWQPNQASNSIGNLILHLNGNVRQWLVASFNGLEDTRDRPAEFAQREIIPVAELMQRLGATMQQASDTLLRLTQSDLLATFHIQWGAVSGLGAVYQVVEHFAMHYGQILFVTKLLRGEDLGFYRELDKTGRLD